MTRWFDRKFEPLKTHLSFDGAVERLRGTPIRLEHLISQIAPDAYCQRQDGTWSIQENAGHLYDLEILWTGRVEDFMAGADELRPADLANAKTHEAGHHERDIADILMDFRIAREKLVELFAMLDDRQLQRTALHPRLKTPMLPVDLAFFVAEHDDHHLHRIRVLGQTFGDIRS